MSKDFINATIEQKPADAKNAFVELITQKLDDALEAKKVQLAQEMFGELEKVELTADEQEFFDSLSDEELEAIANLPDEEELKEEQLDVISKKDKANMRLAKG